MVFIKLELKGNTNMNNINSLTPARFKVNFRWEIFKLILVVNGCPHMSVTEPYLWYVNIGSAITWANVDPDLCRHMASLGHNELKSWHHDNEMGWNSSFNDSNVALAI